ncbi:MAG: hypothetical protein ACQEVA_17595 [Myxococcota bacterium]
MKSRLTLSLVALLAAMLWAGSAVAQVPQTMTYQGRLTDSGGQPLDSTVEVTFRVYDAASGGSEVWSETFATLDVNDGSFSAELGSSEPFGETFDGSDRWLEITIDGETLSPRTPMDSVPYAIKAGTAADADTVGGKTVNEITSGQVTTAADVDYDNTNSGLSATDVQAALDEVAQLRSRVETLETALDDGSGGTVDVASLETQVSTNTGDISTNAGNISTNASDLNGLESRVATNETNISANTGDISALETDVAANTTSIGDNAGDISANATSIGDNAGNIATNATDIGTLQTRVTDLETLTQDMSRQTVNGDQSVLFTGVNVHVRSGSGATDGDTGGGTSVNGLGNLIVGYDEARASGNDKSGSHNIVVGVQHNYSSYGGVVFGRTNAVEGSYATVTGGRSNTASGGSASVTAGLSNTASGTYASVSGGLSNTANGSRSSVSGGASNNAVSSYSSVSGGYNNSASALYASVSGGEENTASGTRASVSGGFNNTASGANASVSGGEENTASGTRASVSGGTSNTAIGSDASVSGGTTNTASGNGASVSGGSSNEASDRFASVSGGVINTASADFASVSGGRNREAGGLDDWRAGSLFEDY